MNQLLWFALTVIRVNEKRFHSALPSLMVSEPSFLGFQVNSQELLHNTNLGAKYPFGRSCKTDKGNIGILKRGNLGIISVGCGWLPCCNYEMPKLAALKCQATPDPGP